MSNAKFVAPQPLNEVVRSYAAQSAEKQQLKSELAHQSATVAEIPLVIGGERSMGKTQKNLTCPHQKSKILAKTAQGGRAEALAAVDASVRARAEWAALPWEERAAVFLKAADLLAGRARQRMNAATMLGQSKTVFQAEIDSACELIDFFRFNAHFAQRIYEEQPFSPAGQWNRSVARGLEGFVYAVTPFNFTSIAVNLPAAPALMGCSVVWKPAATSMLSSLVGLEVLEEAGLPPGVINLVSGDAAEISDVVLNHRELSGIHFTGSTETFNRLWQTVGNNLSKYRCYPRLVGETGGKDFVFAHASADVDSLVTALVRGAFEYQGQKCSAASRAYIPRSLWPKVRDQLVATTESLKMGDPGDFTNFLGAVIDERAYNRIKSYIDHAKSNAGEASILVGGQCDSTNGWFIRPTIIEAKSPTYKSMVEEIFGPVLTVYVYDDARFEETIELCDSSTPYALTGAVFARDRRVVHHMTRALENAAGNFYINDKPTGAVVGQQPFGGGRASGTNDKAGSIFNLLRWVSHRTIKENFHPITDYRYPFMLES